MASRSDIQLKTKTSAQNDGLAKPHSQKPQIQIEDALCFNLYTASRLMTQAYADTLKSLKLTYPQFLVMNLLWSNQELDLKHIGQRLYLDSGTLTPLINRLVTLEYVVKSPSPLDERKLILKLTRKGKSLQTKSENVPLEMFCKLNVDLKRFVEIRDGVCEVLHNLENNLKESKTKKQKNKKFTKDLP